MTAQDSVPDNEAFPMPLPGLGRAIIDGIERVVAVVPGMGVVPLDLLTRDADTSVIAVIEKGRWTEYGRLLREFIERFGSRELVPLDNVAFCAPIDTPRKIWGIGLNYREHAQDLSADVPEEPASFVKCDHTIIGPKDPIEIPWQSRRVTAEAELGLVIGRLTRKVPEDQALSHVAGIMPILDQTAEDILELNPRFLTRAKNFPGFFSSGPWVTPLSSLPRSYSIESLRVATIINGKVHRENSVSQMRFSPAFLISFHSEVMPLFPGDIISTGTPGAIAVESGDVVECHITGLPVLSNPVR